MLYSIIKINKLLIYDCVKYVVFIYYYFINTIKYTTKYTVKYTTSCQKQMLK